MNRKIKRASILIVITYIMINSLAWGLMKAYVNSYNAVNREKLVMAQVSDKPDGREVKILGKSFLLSQEEKQESEVLYAVKSVAPVKLKSISAIFKQIGLEIVQEVLQ